MKVKDLRDYLSLHDVSTEMCREKEELVLLVLGQQPVISQEGRTRAPTLSPDFPEHQAFRTQPQASTVPPTSARLPSSPAQATSVFPAQAQESQQVHPPLCRLSWLPCLHSGGGGSILCEALLPPDAGMSSGPVWVLFFPEMIMHGTRYFCGFCMFLIRTYPS